MAFIVTDFFKPSKAQHPTRKNARKTNADNVSARRECADLPGREHGQNNKYQLKTEARGPTALRTIASAL
jgi:hypothetical protein